ncbi:MAG: hypothetical protein H0W69_10685 [Gemmatimonadaceae bacterium]|nr:hypothetical protein [Gemmatimonadaceae bacterium]
MENNPGRKSPTINSALTPFSPLVGSWKTIGRHPLLPHQVLHGRTSFEWLEEGAFLIMHSEMEGPDIPSGVAIIGSDDSAGEFMMLYFDERGVSRKYEISIHNNIWKWWRDFPGFSQRFTCTISDDARTMVGKGELSRDNSSWEGDLDLTYTRME